VDRERGEPKDNERSEGEFHPLRKVKGGMKVISRRTGKAFSKHPQSNAMAHAQLGAIESHIHQGN
jgi:hypothetical protein